jgi:hypothetical protein
MLAKCHLVILAITLSLLFAAYRLLDSLALSRFFSSHSCLSFASQIWQRALTPDFTCVFLKKKSNGKSSGPKGHSGFEQRFLETPSAPTTTFVYMRFKIASSIASIVAEVSHVFQRCNQQIREITA